MLWELYYRAPFRVRTNRKPFRKMQQKFIPGDRASSPKKPWGKVLKVAGQVLVLAAAGVLVYRMKAERIAMLRKMVAQRFMAAQ